MYLFYAVARRGVLLTAHIERLHRTSLRHRKELKAVYLGGDSRTDRHLKEAREEQFRRVFV